MTTDEYDDRWRKLAAAGHNPHGEADLIASLQPSSLLDAGCGTGRVAIELARRGIDVVGVDLDETMLAAARSKAPAVTWVHADLASVDLARQFDVVALPGNVMIFVEPSDRGRVVARMAAHLIDGGALIAGFQLRRGLELGEYDAAANAAGLVLERRLATWEGAPYVGGDYAVSIHRAYRPDDQRRRRTTVHDLLAEARTTAPRITPGELHRCIDDDDLIVLDTRPTAVVSRTGWIRDSVHAPRTVLEWRVDPAGGHQHHRVVGFDQRLVVVCAEGYSSTLAAATLRRLGFARATDLVGGIDGWRAAGLPLVAPAGIDLEGV